MPAGTGTVMGVAAIVLGAMGIGNLQDKAPAADAKTPRADAPAIAQDDAAMQRRVSGKFENASLGEVLRWLGGQGISFVADSSQLAGDSKLTMNIVNQPLGDVADAIAGAFNGKWERHGSVYTFTRGRGMFAPEADARAFGFEMPGGKNFKFFAPDGQHLKELEKLGPEIGKHMEEAMKELEMKGLMDKDGKHFKFLMPDMKELKELGQLGPEVEKHIAETMKQLEKEGLMKDGKAFKFEMPDMKEFKLKLGDLKELKELEKLEGVPLVKIHSGDVVKLIDSLSNEQRAKHEKQGYLTRSDLTKEQRAMLGNMPDGADWTISYSINGKKLTIKGK